LAGAPRGRNPGHLRIEGGILYEEGSVQWLGSFEEIMERLVFGQAGKAPGSGCSLPPCLWSVLFGKLLMTERTVEFQLIVSWLVKRPMNVKQLVTMGAHDPHVFAVTDLFYILHLAMPSHSGMDTQ
jgi:hypothetical protein